MQKKIALKERKVAGGASAIHVVDKQTVKFIREHLERGIVEYKFKYESIK